MFTPTLYFDDAGQIVRAVLNDSAAALDTAPHPQATGTPITFDADTNQALLDALLRSTAPYRRSGGVLTRDGQPVAINPPDPAQVERAAATTDLRDQYAAASTTLDAIIARNGTFTLAQAGQALDALAKGQKRLLRLLKAQLG